MPQHPLRLRAAVAALLLALALTGCVPEPGLSPEPGGTATPDATAPTPGPAPTADADDPAAEDPDGRDPASAAAAAYCTDQGGEVQQRQPMFGTNGEASTWIALGDPVSVCRFQAGDGESATRLYVDLVSLHSERPTLAALAYLAKLPVTAAGEDAAAGHCLDLGGAVSYGPTIEGGGLVAADDPVDTVVSACTFSDGSFLDEWAIASYSADTVRGADLAAKFRFDTGSLPPVFPESVG